ncbi:MAG: Ger(x)C family spore germination protein, partial [Bacillota bacterium]
MALVKKTLLVSLLVFLLLAGAGCWNRRDPELLGIVLAAAFDYDTEKEMYLVIAQLASPQALQTEGGGSGKPSFWVLSAHGHTPFEAMRNLGVGSSRELFWAHNRVILFSENAARRGISEIMDVIERERQTRVIALPAVVQGDIRKLMEAEFPLEDSGAIGLDRQMITIQFNTSVFHNKFLNEVYSAFEAPGQEVFLGKIEVQAEDDQVQQGGAGSGGAEGGGSQNRRPPALVGGGALFKGDRLVGWATQNQTEGWLLAMGRGQRFNFVMECPDSPGDYFSVEVFNVGAVRRPVVDEQGNPRVILKVEANSRIQNYTCDGNLSTDNAFIISLERRTAEAIRNRITDMIKRSQQLGTDVMGFGNLFYRKQPRVWRELAER